jgi:hypothetical protein
MNESMLLLISGYSEREFLFVLIVGIIGVCLYFNGITTDISRLSAGWRWLSEFFEV